MPVTNNVMLKVSNIDVYYGNVQALWDISMEVRTGEALAILGANGAGKTTLLRTISGFNVPSSGDIVFMGESIAGMEPFRIAQKGIAHVAEGRKLFPSMSVGENLLLGGHLLPDDEKQRRLQWVFELFPRLYERIHQAAGSLSGGEQQMVALGRALMSKPKLLLLDEPSTGLAPILVPVLFGAIDQIIKEEALTVVIVEQHVREAFKHVERAYIIENGRITMEGTPEELQNDDRVKRAYLGVV